MPIFNKTKLKFNFNKAANSYNQFAQLQKIVANNLVKIIAKELDNSSQILDLGCGTGFIAQNILTSPRKKKKFIIQLDIARSMLKKSQLANVSNINADIEALPFQSKTFDLVTSSLAFQWLNDLQQTIIEVAKILKPKASLAFSIIGKNSLKELTTSCHSCGVNLSINSFIQKSTLEKIISPIFDYQIQQEVIILKYQDLMGLLKSIKSIGAGYSFNNNFLSKKDFAKVNNFYLKNFRSDNKVFCTWRIFYVICKLKNNHV